MVVVLLRVEIRLGWVYWSFHSPTKLHVGADLSQVSMTALADVSMPGESPCLRIARNCLVWLSGVISLGLLLHFLLQSPSGIEALLAQVVERCGVVATHRHFFVFGMLPPSIGPGLARRSNTN